MTLSRLGVVIVTFNSADVILDCLESLLASDEVALDIAVVDNCSTDRTLAVVRAWAAGQATPAAAEDIPFPMAVAPKPLSLTGGDNLASPHHLTLIETGINAGYAAGVNRGLARLAALPGLDRYWVLNPDIVVPARTAQAFATCPVPAGGFSLMGSRVLYLDHPAIIQIDGGTLNRLTGVTSNINLFAEHRLTPPPSADAMDFITGASMVVSRQFYQSAGPMPEEYFLYYEEVDWAMRRGALPLLYCGQALVYHRTGTAIGSPTLGRPASPFSLYFKHRARRRFMWRYHPYALPVAYAYSLAKAAQLLVKGYPAEARAVLGACLGLPPSPGIRARLSPEAARLAFPPR